MTWYDSNWNCQPAIPNCNEKADLIGCSGCKGQGDLSGTTPKTCNPPICEGMSWFNTDWNC